MSRREPILWRKVHIAKQRWVVEGQAQNLHLAKVCVVKEKPILYGKIPALPLGEDQ